MQTVVASQRHPLETNSFPRHITAMDANDHLIQAARDARSAAHALARSSREARDAALRCMADALRDGMREILAANAADVACYQGSAAFLDRLTLTEARVEAMAKGLEDVAALPDPLNRVLAEWTRPNGLRFQRIATPIGVIGMIYESRPNVGADAAALCLKSGNAVILRGGSDSANSAHAIAAALQRGLAAANMAPGCVQVAPNADRAYVAAMLAGAGLLDLIIPRGGKSLVERVQREARVPVLAHAEGLNHTYVHEAADPAMARAILANAKMRRTGICGATETLLIDRAVAPSLLPLLVADLQALGCNFRADAAARDIVPSLPAATPADFDTEWLELDPVRRRCGRRRVCLGPHRPPRQRAYRRDRHPGCRRRPHLPPRCRQRRRALERLHPILRRRGVRVRSRDRHRHGTDPRPRPCGPGAVDDLSHIGPRLRTGTSLIALDPLPRFGDRRRIRVGLLGGSFNPAHDGHRHAAMMALRRLRLDQVWLMVSPGNPLKPCVGMAPLAERLAGAQKIADGRRMLATGIEAAFRTRYTVDTLRLLLKRFANVRFVWIMGADILQQLPRWRRWQEITERLAFVVLPRPSYTYRALAGQAAHRLRAVRRPVREAVLLPGDSPGWAFLPGRQSALSATAIRQASEGTVL